MFTWIILSFPVAVETNIVYTFGLVSASDEQRAREVVLEELERQGYDIGKAQPSDVGLYLWKSKEQPYAKCVLYSG